MSTSKLILQRSTIVGVAALLGLALAEAAIRVSAARRPVFELRGLHEFRPDRPWLYGLRPGAEGRLALSGGVLYRINDDGFRDARVARPKPPGVFRIMLLGDSISFGYGVAEEEAFPQVLEAGLHSSLPEVRIEVLNLGVGGYNAWNQVELLRDLAVGYEPDLVLVQFCINDLNDPTMHFDAQTRMHLGAIPDAAYPDPSQRAVAARRPSTLLSTCRRLRLCAGLDDLRIAWTTPDFDNEMRRAAAMLHEGGSGPEWSWLETRYREMESAAADSGARFAVIAFPYRRQVSKSGPHPVQEHLLSLGRRHGWLIVDPLPAFRRARERSLEPLFVDLWHPTPAGHRIAAEAVREALICSDLLPEPARAGCSQVPQAGASTR